MNDHEIDSLSKEQLAYIVRQMKDWTNGETCPKQVCKGYPCKGEAMWLATLTENVASGDLDEPTRLQYIRDGYDRAWCDVQDGDECCWPDYYLWCLMNHVDPDTGRPLVIRSEAHQE